MIEKIEIPGFEEAVRGCKEALRACKTANSELERRQHDHLFIKYSPQHGRNSFEMELGLIRRLREAYGSNPEELDWIPDDCKDLGNSITFNHSTYMGACPGPVPFSNETSGEHVRWGEVMFKEIIKSDSEFYQILVRETKEFIETQKQLCVDIATSSDYLLAVKAILLRARNAGADIKQQRVGDTLNWRFIAEYRKEEAKHAPEAIVLCDKAERIQYHFSELIEALR